MKNQISSDHFRTWISQNKTNIVFFTVVALVILVILWMTGKALVKIEKGSIGFLLSGISSLKQFLSNK